MDQVKEIDLSYRDATEGIDAQIFLPHKGWYAVTEVNIVKLSAGDVFEPIDRGFCAMVRALLAHVTAGETA